MNLDNSLNLLLTQPCFLSLVTNSGGDIVSFLFSENFEENNLNFNNSNVANVFPNYISDNILKSIFDASEKGYSKIDNFSDSEYSGFCSIETKKINYFDSILFLHNIIRVRKVNHSSPDENDVFKTVFEKATVGIAQVRLDSSFIMMNKMFCDILGYTKKELMKISLRELTYPEDLEISATYFKNILDGKTDHYSLEKRYIHKNGSIIWVDLFVSVIVDSNCNPEYFISIIRDITQRKKTEQKLSLLFNQSTLGIIEWDLDGCVKDLNKKAQDILGYTLEEVKGQDCSFCVPQNSDLDLEYLPDNGKSRSNFHRNLCKDGKLIWCEWVSNPLTDDKGKLISIFSFIKDVTEKIENEQALIESESRLSSMVENSPAGAVYVENGEIYFNKAVEKIIGYTRDEIKTIDDWFICLYKENALEVIQMYEEDQKIGFPEPRIMYVNCKNEEQKWLYISSYKHRKGEIWLVNDVTESTESEIELIKKNKELLLSKNKAEENDKLKTAFLANVSHEIRTPMNSIIGFSEMLLDPDLSTEELKEYADIIINAGKRLLYIVEDIIDISKIEANQIEALTEKVNVNSVINEIFTTYTQNTGNKNIVFEKQPELDDEASLIYCDKSKLYKILNKLLSNAFKFTEKGHIKYGYRVDDDLLEFFVEDTGIGIDPSLHDKIFETFRQVELDPTREYEGAGLGLAISKSFIDLLGGKIWLESELGKGARFFFTIPYNPVVVKRIENTEHLVDKTKRKTILVVDDDKDNNMLLIVVLSKKNYNVLSAFNGSDAIELCKNHPEIDLVLMDIKMDQMNGVEAAKEIKKIRPNLKIFAQTAYHNEKYFNMDFDNYFDKYISKPIKHHLLLAMIKEELDN